MLKDAEYSIIARHKYRANKDSSNDNILIPGPRYKPKNVIEKVFENIKSRKNTPPLSSSTPIKSNPECRYLNILFNNTLIVDEPLIFDCQEKETFFKDNVEKTPQESLCLEQQTINQGISGHWKSQRRLRITASQCYNLYTYFRSKNEEKKDWSKKIRNYVDPKFFFSKAVEYGKLNEQFAFLEYQKQCPNKIISLGLIVHPKMSWLGCSPDGFDETRKVLIEIKCPLAGSDLPLDELLPTLSYLEFKEGIYNLKSNHQYYGQVQLSLFVLNLSICDFVIYSKKANSVAVIEVKLNESFVKKLVTSLKSVYESHMLPYLLNNIK